MIYATWCISNNVGDVLTHWLIKKISGESPVYVERGSYCQHHICCGSILNWSNKNSIVWGAGIANANDEIAKPFSVHAVRGPISNARLRAVTGMSTSVLGDPALLLKRFYAPVVEKKYDVGIIPHYVDQQIISQSYLAYNQVVKVIDVFGSVEQFIEDVCSCRSILSSSLHGLIIATAYEIPSRWFEASMGVGGDTTKFHDFFLSVGNTPYYPLKLYDFQWQSPEDLRKLVGEFRAKCDLSTLLNSCPFKK